MCVCVSVSVHACVFVHVDCVQVCIRVNYVHSKADIGGLQGSVCIH